ncbi:MAG: hypothetical protein HIU84_09295 [Acidobacteria bacterium]|nr:hypothetical protein [Acidobacteriota bacterium]
MGRLASRSVGGLLLATLLAVLSPAVAFGSDHRPSNDSHAGTTTTITTNAPDGSNSTSDSSTPTSDRKNWREEMSTYHQARLAINQAFKSAISSAHAIYQSALAQATSVSGRSTARAAYVLALTQAVAARDAALINLGRPPSIVHARSSNR